MKEGGSEGTSRLRRLGMLQDTDTVYIFLSLLLIFPTLGLLSDYSLLYIRREG